LRCIAQLCSDDNFQPEDGRSYEVTFVLQGQKDGIRFGDWEQTDLEMAPAVYLRGLPGELDLAQMPVEGWPIELTAGTTEEIGTISAKIRLSDTQSGEIIADVGVEFMEDVPESGSLTTTLLINGLATLRPGSYSGELTLEAADPAGRPIDVRIRPGAELPVTLTVPRPLAHIDSQLADFGSILFNTSPNFRLDQELLIPIRFDGSPFAVSAQIRDSNCQDLSVVSGELRERAGQQFLPLRLTSPGPVTAGSCAGELILSGPDPDHDVLPGQIGWQMNVDNLEWSLVNGDLALGDLQNAGERTEGVLLIRYNGETPFVMEVRDIRAAARDETRSITLDAESLDIPPIEVTGEPNEAGLYEVPVAFVARQSVPTDQQQGLFYSGALALGLVGLADNEQMIAFSFRSPSFIQRYVAPIVVPVYSMPWAICTWPFTLLFFLVLIARIRGRNVDEEAIEEAAAAAAMHMTSQADIESDAARWAPEQSLDIRNSEAGPTWDNAEWGSVWAGNGAQDRGPDSDSGPAQEKRDPWTSNW
jgi:hypothetical protein